MRIDNEKISGRRFLFTATCFTQASSLLAAFLVTVVFQDAWLVALIGGFVCLPLIWLYRELMVMFPGKNLLHILDEVYGPVAGKVLGTAYLWFFFTLASLNITDLSSLTKVTILEKTPSLVLSLTCVLVAAVAVRRGAGLVTRYSALFTITAFAIMGLSFLLVFNQLDIKNLFPMFDQPPMKYVQGVHIISTIPFGELVAMLMLNANLKITPKETTRYLFLSFFLGAFSVLVILVRDVAALGNTIDMFAVPSLMVMRLFSLGVALGRLEVLFAVVLVMLLFFKVMVLYYVAVIAAAQLLKVKEYRHLVLSMGVLMVLYGMTLYPSNIEHTESGQRIIPFLWTPFELLLPLLTLVVAKVQRRRAGAVKEA
ncbi:putative Spore germination protein (Amino acid permease) [uncultured Eubacteriales bacterium]|uniref:Putative Spore germination protein (Amino acid permease) n=1 Tax=uncultured Eubacteriales bacterium TaxID=172733 RepID=A0A212K9M5_9FIRM|nr:putative Spore germination protein (Amino acid permease) [uncultured Eubacteriales bacterium]